MAMRLRRLLTRASFGLSVALSLALVAPHARADDFDPRGRKKPGAPPPKPAGKPGAPTPPNPGAAPAKPGPGGRPPGGTNGEAGQTQSALIDRYTKIVLSQPGVLFPLQRLAQLYRDKDG